MLKPGKFRNKQAKLIVRDLDYVRRYYSLPEITFIDESKENVAISTPKFLFTKLYGSSNILVAPSVEHKSLLGITKMIIQQHA